MSRRKRKPVLQSLANGLGLTCVTLLILAFDEGQAGRAVDAVREGVSPMVDRAGAYLKGQAAPVAPPPAAGAYPVLFGHHEARGNTATGPVEFAGAEIRTGSAGVLRTEPLRIAHGGEAFAGPLRLPPEAQVELRRVVPLKGQTSVAPSPLCQGQAPGWIALSRKGAVVEMMVFRVGAAPGTTDPARALCGHWTYVKP
ncbi:hypothetical protein GVN24_23385 [Rhizobium sp. CRIBSB]|nr:hypothetical protein [Rhizobium sp. CRIBSB]